MDFKNRKMLDKALTVLRGQPDAKLLRQHGNSKGSGFVILSPHNSFVVSDEVAMAILEHNDMQPCDSGLLPGHPQSWVFVRTLR